MLHWELRLLIQLSVTEISYIYPLRSSNSLIDYPYVDKISRNTDDIFKGAVKREIVHCLIMNGGKADITTLKEASEKLFVETDHFEEVLWEVAE